MRMTWKSSIITEGSMAKRKLAPIHPGEVLALDFLEPLAISQYRLAKDISVPARRINEIVHGTRAISADTALRLARHFGTSDQFWLNLQASHRTNLRSAHPPHRSVPDPPQHPLEHQVMHRIQREPIRAP